MSLRQNQQLVVAVVYVAAMFMAIMDTTIVNVALPTLGREFHTRADGVDLVSIAFLVSLAVFIPVSGWLGDRIGGRRALLGAIGVFTIASALCGLATSLAELVVFRVLQGVGGGLMTPVGLSMLFRVFPPAERVRAASILVVPTALAPASGPVLGGLFTTDLSWRWVFYVNAPIGVAAFAFGALFLAGHRQPDPGRLDIPGFLLSGLGLGSVMYGVSEGPITSWSSVPVIATIAIGLALLAAAIAAELRAANPLIDLRLFRDRLFSATTGVFVLGSTAFLGALYLAALFFQDGLGRSALRSGLTIFPQALGVMAGSQLATRLLYPRFGPRRIMIGGLLVVTGTLMLMARVTADTDEWLLRLVMLAFGVGMSGVFVPAQAASFATISPARTGRASSIFNAGKQLGGAIGVALMTTVLAAIGPTRGVGVANLAAFHDSFLVAAAVAVVAAVVALTVHDADAAATMVRRPHHHSPQDTGRAGRHPDRSDTPLQLRD
ncbi:MAG TPA: MDR family MFS transporter [Pseudonocardiaceae bacterium]|jgi:EmrB/QacA subfamily drug resistance transporter|nr:MDR family MFS transporter [Pseudonocardiaceae bacterium]